MAVNLQLPVPAGTSAVSISIEPKSMVVFEALSQTKVDLDDIESLFAEVARIELPTRQTMFLKGIPGLRARERRIR